MAGETSLLPSTPYSYTLLLLLLLVFAAATEGVKSSGERRVLNLIKLQLGEESPMWTCLPQKARMQDGATILEVRQHDYCRGQFQSWEEKTKQMMISDEARVQSLQSRMANTPIGRIEDRTSKAQFPLTSGVKLQTLNYIVTVELGGAKKTVIVDTGSDLTWVQCKPCLFCYSQKDPLFDPSTSPSYQPIPCNSATCGSLQLATGTTGACATNQTSCKYALSYGDGSYTRGELARERINLAGTTVDGFVFGCGRSNRGLFGGASGLMGLGRSELSLVSQTLPYFGGVFSYCLPSREFDSSGSLILGGDSSVYKNSTPITYTRIVSDPQMNPFYLLNLTGMSIGGVRLQASGFSTGRILIDSGTVITRLVPSIYKALKAEFLSQFSGYPSAPGFSILDTCFNLAGYQEVNVPTLKLKFEGGAEAIVDVGGMFYFVKRDASQVCLALASLPYEDELGIIGNYQQKNLRLVYDTVGSKLGFAEETCAYS
uniref:Aspartic proteinase nepenthesin-1 n=2 Tax=Anthurium amnicola TaxID=1678845 RepID=A0A1D1Z2E8_9ARAE